MVNRVLTVSLLAGLLAGLLVAALQHVTTTPLILRAEAYETALKGHPAATAAAFDGAARIVLAHTHGGEAAADHAEWKPRDALQRTLFTSLVTIATGIGFAALLLAGMIAANETIDERRAMIWAACGFVAFGLIPATGLAPELPGSAAAELAHRQIWWIATALVTAAGLFVFLKMGAPWLRALAVLVLLVPHLVGAPHPVAPESKVPAEIAAHFAALSLAVQAALWLATGFAVGVLWPWATPRGCVVTQPERAQAMPASPRDDLTIHVCTVCRRKREDLPEGFDQPGLALAEALTQRLADKGSTIPVLAVECLAVCKRPCTVAFAADGKWTYLIGDLDTQTHLDEIVGAAESYAASANGIVPWKERPVSFRKGVVARVPPLPARQQG